MCVDCKSYSHFFSKKFQYICVSLDVDFNDSLTNDIVSFEQLGPGFFIIKPHVVDAYQGISNEHPVCDLRNLN